MVKDILLFTELNPSGKKHMYVYISTVMGGLEGPPSLQAPPQELKLWYGSPPE